MDFQVLIQQDMDCSEFLYGYKMPLSSLLDIADIFHSAASLLDDIPAVERSVSH